MRAVIAASPGGPEALEVVERPDPRPAPDELLLAVHAAGVNRADVLQREGRYPPPEGASDVLGLEAAGEVLEVGSQVSGWSPGDRAIALLAGGGYAERAVVPATIALPWPARLDAAEAGCAYEVLATAEDNLIRRGRLARGEVALIHGGTGGVGTAAIQLARRHGARALVTVGSAEKAAAARDLGADAAIVHTEEDFVAATRERTGGRGVDVVLDVVGGAYLERNLRALAADGRLVVIGLQGGARAELDLARLLTRRLSVAASTLRARPREQKEELAAHLRSAVWPGLADGTLRPVVAATYPLAEAARAHEHLERREHVGNVVLTVASR